MQLEDIKKLAVMARIDMSDAEMTEMAHDFDGILSYVGHVQDALKLIEVIALEDRKIEDGLINVAREDMVTNRGGEYTSKIIAEFPDMKDGYLKVKQIL
jgi:aspartyl/glutamyl-tRNA(Asn/Gln) amidotransferase C subunit